MFYDSTLQQPAPFRDFILSVFCFWISCKMIAIKMELDHAKLFIGGISWDTDEDRLKDYFGSYGEVVEAVIMRDRATGRARGFGFIVFADPSVAERVVIEKHMIDGRTVEAKKAVPRDEQLIQNRNISSVHGSPGPGRTKKIFVGGLASTVTESDFKAYFDQFGTITDVVVMYDHNTQRPRGFGFITYDLEEAVDRVLHKTFHELNGKMVEVKRAVPKEMSPRPSQSPLIGFNNGLTRANSLLSSYVQEYNISPGGSYGVRMDGRFNSIASGQNGFSSFGSGYGLRLNLEQGLSPSYGGFFNLTNNLGYGRVLSPYYNGNTNRYNIPIGYNASNGRSDSPLNSIARNVWTNESANNVMNSNPASPGGYMGSRSQPNWGFAPISSQNGMDPYINANLSYGNEDGSYGLGAGARGPVFGRNSSTSTGEAPTSSFVSSSAGFEGSYGNMYRGGSFYGDSTWGTAASELDDASASFGRYGLNSVDTDVTAKSSEGYTANYSVTTRQSTRGIAA